MKKKIPVGDWGSQDGRPAARCSHSPHAVDVYDVGVAQWSEAVVLGPQIVESSPPLREGQIRAHAFGHHIPPSILTGEHGAEGAVGDEL